VAKLITVIDAGIGNFLSVANMLKYLEFEVDVQSNPKRLQEVTHLILPGIGSFDAGIECLRKSGWHDAILKLDPSVNILGICLGMQLLGQGSEEGLLPGLGLVKATCSKFKDQSIRVPHIGWNQAAIIKQNRLLPLNETEYKFYFSHSYYLKDLSGEIGILETNYGGNFVSAYQHKNVYGVQFHPEKSHKYGMELLKNFGSLPC